MEAYEISWQALAINDALPVPLAAWLTWALVAIVLFLGMCRIGGGRSVALGIGVMVSLTVTLVGIKPNFTNAYNRDFSIQSNAGSATIACQNQTIAIQTEVEVRITAITPSFPVTNTYTAICGTECEAGSALAPGAECTLRCPSDGSADSDGDGVTDTSDAYECDPTSSFFTKISGL